jgi:hypothetical protein
MHESNKFMLHQASHYCTKAMQPASKCSPAAGLQACGCNLLCCCTDAQVHLTTLTEHTAVAPAEERAVKSKNSPPDPPDTALTANLLAWPGVPAKLPLTNTFKALALRIDQHSHITCWVGV